MSRTAPEIIAQWQEYINQGNTYADTAEYFGANRDTVARNVILPPGHKSWLYKDRYEGKNRRLPWDKTEQAAIDDIKTLRGCFAKVQSR